MKAFLLVLVLLTLVGCERRGKEPALPSARAVAPLTPEALRNASYRSEWVADGQVRLEDGAYHGVSQDDAIEVHVMLSDHYAFGDLDGDGVDDAAVILVSNAGGSGSFVDLAAVRNQGGEAVNEGLIALGDRTQVDSIYIRDGAIHVRAVQHGPADPMCCPTLDTTRVFQLKQGMLVENRETPRAL